MSLPIRTTLDDISKLCNYFASKPTGATIQEAKRVLDSKLTDSRKISALKFWGLLEDDSGKLKVTNDGRLLSKNETDMISVLRNVIIRIAPYFTTIEMCHHSHMSEINAIEVGAKWHDHFKEQVSESDRVLNDQAVCFFQIASGAQLGEIKVGRKGQPTRIILFSEKLTEFLSNSNDSQQSNVPDNPEDSTVDLPETGEQIIPPKENLELGKGIFIAHGKNKKPLEQLKSILSQFKVSYKVAIDEPNLGRPIGSKVKETMHACNCAILIFTADEEFTNPKGETVWRPSENVVYELGASSYLYGSKVVILKEDEVVLPSNFKELGYISFEKDKLDAKTMDVIKELIGFGILKVST